MACAAIAATLAEIGGGTAAAGLGEAVSISAADALAAGAASGLGEAVSGAYLGAEFGGEALASGLTGEAVSGFTTDAALGDTALGADGVLSKAALDGTTAFGANSVAGAFDLAGAPAAATPFQQAMNSLGLGSVKDAAQFASPVMSLFSGLTAEKRAAALRAAAAQAAAKSDPFGTSGGRALADAQLQELMRNPGGVAKGDPSYALRIQGAQRANAQYGQDSGAMSVAGANASTSWYNERLQQLGGLAGSGFNPGYGAQISLQGQEAAAGLESAGQASMGYGLTRLTGGDTGAMTPQQQQALIQLALKAKG